MVERHFCCLAQSPLIQATVWDRTHQALKSSLLNDWLHIAVYKLWSNEQPLD
jgi:hypothetical protein